MTQPAFPQRYSTASEPLAAEEPLTTTVASIISIADLSIVAREAIAADDPFALWIIDAASEAVRSTAGQPTWDSLTAPTRARNITAHLAARSYLNFDSVTRENIGPIGSSTAEELAKALHLTNAEREELIGLAGGTQPAGGGGMWVQPLSDPVQTTTLGDTVYLSDSSGSLLAYYDPNDVGAP